MAVMLICELPDAVPTLDNDVIDDATDRPSALAVSILTSHCEWPRNILHPVDLRQRRRRRRRRRRRPNDESRLTSSTNASMSNNINHLVDFTVCVPPIYGNVSVTELVEFIEVNRTLDHSLFLSCLSTQVIDVK